MPQVTCSNTQTSSVMIGTKGGEMLLQDLKRADDEGPGGLGAEPSDLRARLLLPQLSFRIYDSDLSGIPIGQTPHPLGASSGKIYHESPVNDQVLWRNQKGDFVKTQA